MAPIFESSFSIRSILGIPSSSTDEKDEENQRYQNNDQQLRDQLSPPISNQRPPYTYTALIAMAIRSSSRRHLTLNEISVWITTHFPFFQKNNNTWQNSIRHTLTMNQCFVKVARTADDPGRGHYWTLNPSSEDAIIDETTGRLVKNNPVSGNNYSCVHHYHVHFHHPQGPTTSYEMYFPRLEQMMAMQQYPIYGQQMWNYAEYQQQQQILQNGDQFKYLDTPMILQ